MGFYKTRKKGPELVLNYHPDDFADGVRILMLTTRSKDGGRTNNPDRQPSNKKYVTRSISEYYEKLDELIEEMGHDQRIYSTVDSRDLEKAQREFKFRLLESDYYDEESRDNFYIDIYNRWISCLQSPPARETSLFLFDIDDDGDNDWTSLEELMDQLETLPEPHNPNPYKYRTKNGWHVITQPFNPALVDAKPQKNAMLLVAYYKDNDGD